MADHRHTKRLLVEAEGGKTKTAKPKKKWLEGVMTKSRTATQNTSYW